MTPAHNRSALNADKEMRRLFGGNAAAAGGPGARAQRRGGRGGGGSMGHKLPGKKTSIVTPQDHWPSALHCGVGMVASSAADGRPGVYYELRYTDEYRQGQQLFAAMAATHDPQNLVDVLHQHPYQLDTLLQMSQIYAQMGEQQQAADMLERAVFCLELASHPAFIAGLGGAAEGGGGGTRLDYALVENQVYFHAMFRQMQAAGRRGSNRAAFELAKMLLSLDLRDPLGVLLCIDYYALRCRMFAFVQDLYAYYDNTPASHSHHHVPALPNMAFSHALALFNVETGVTAARAKNRNTETGGSGGADATGLLENALLRFPLVLSLLLEKACVPRETGAWAPILAHEVKMCVVVNASAQDRLHRARAVFLGVSMSVSATRIRTRARAHTHTHITCW